VLGEYERILKDIRHETDVVREENRKNARKNNSHQYSQNTMYMAGLYKAMSIVSDHIKRELSEYDKWADEHDNDISA